LKRPSSPSSAAARNNVPAVYGQSYFVRDGGLLSYGPDAIDPYRRAATYVDRILRGEKPGDLSVQFISAALMDLS
jgi:putative ABC transport system substrate-binding protein